MKIAKSIIAVLFVLVVIFGLFMAFNKGINTGLIYTEREQVGIMIGSQFEASDMKNIANEVFENEKYLIQKATIFEDTVIFQAKEITDTQKQKLVEKITEKYSLDIKLEDVETEKVGARDLKKDLEKYILPFSITLFLIIAYFIFRFKKLGALRTMVRFVTTVIFAELLYISVLSISQIEIGRLFAPIGFMLYMLCVIVSTAVFEKERAELIFNENNK